MKSLRFVFVLDGIHLTITENGLFLEAIDQLVRKL